MKIAVCVLFVTCVCLPADEIFVADNAGHAVHEYTEGGVLIRDLTLPAGEFNPYDLVVGPDGSLYVANRNYGSIEHFDTATGAYLGTTADVHAIGLNPAGMTLGPDGNLYFSSTSNNGVYEVNLSGGNAVTNVPSPASGGPYDLVFDPVTGALLSNDVNSKVLFDGVAGPNNIYASGLSGPFGMAFGPDGRLYVTDQFAGNSSVVAIPAGGGAPTLFSTNNIFSTPRYLAFDSQGNLWVADQGSNRLIELNSTGATIGAFHTSNPFGVAIIPGDIGTPEPASFFLVLAGTIPAWLRMRRR